MVFQDPYLSLDPRQTPWAAIDEVIRLHTPARSAGACVALAGAVRAGRHRRTAAAITACTAVRRTTSARGNRSRAGRRAPAVDSGRIGCRTRRVDPGAGVEHVADVRERIGVAYLFISHDLAVVRQVSDRIVVMKDGRSSRSGHGQVLDDPQHPYTQLLARQRPATRLEAQPPNHRTTRGGRTTIDSAEVTTPAAPLGTTDSGWPPPPSWRGNDRRRRGVVVRSGAAIPRPDCTASTRRSTRSVAWCRRRHWLSRGRGRGVGTVANHLPPSPECRSPSRTCTRFKGWELCSASRAVGNVTMTD